MYVCVFYTQNICSVEKSFVDLDIKIRTKKNHLVYNLLSLQTDMNFKLLLISLVALALVDAKKYESNRSSKKGVVISGWSNFLCGDFYSYKTVSWYYNYFTNRDFLYGLRG